MSNDKDKAEKLLQESKGQSRHKTEPESAGTPTLEDAVADAYRRLENNDLPSNITLRDDNLAALFVGLEKSGELSPLGEATADALGREATIDTRADVLRLLLRYAISEIDGSILERGKAGRTQYLTESDDF